uniref:Uncharacterized protein n=1 Tax=Attheya septentrionalis TaxID=420275 RepID=A0A7S2XRD7_9STRA
MARKQKAKKSQESLPDVSSSGTNNVRNNSVDMLVECIWTRCGSRDEAQIIAEAVLSDALPRMENCDSDDEIISQIRSECASTLRDYFEDLTEEQSLEMIHKSIYPVRIEKEDEDHDSHDVEEPLLYDNDSENDSDGEFIGEGECELCERTIRLTRHHLIPKSTWPKLKQLFLANAQEPSELEDTFSNFPKQVNRDTIRQYLQTTCHICRPCHSMVHRIHDNKTLAESFHTVDLLLTDENVVKFCKWANKQRPGKHSIHR